MATNSFGAAFSSACLLRLPAVSAAAALQLGRKVHPTLRCRSDAAGSDAGGDRSELRIGTPVVVVDAPLTLKTATPMPSLRVNSGLVKPGDVGRIVARKPKDVWAVRLAIGTYLIDGKHFKPLDIDE